MSTMVMWTKGHENTAIAGYVFDAVIEQAFTASVEMPTYPIENGVQIADHRIIQPMEYVLHGVVSNTPIKVSLTDFAGGLVSNLTNNPAVAAVAGLSAGYLSGSEDGRALAAMEKFMELMESKQPFDVDTGDMYLRNMQIVEIHREMTPENERVAEIELRLREMITLNRLNTDGMPSHNIVRPDTATEKSGSGITAKISGGLKTLHEAEENAKNTVKGWFA